ncbi:MAG: peptide synthase [Gammaproteobacteria bacterium HGW-Gammaproteobacteria-8]|nr:MAG: peptide synthase [Gammaproteobacteria bacterium HGW-Gammaproteobacteria-8]
MSELSHIADALRIQAARQPDAPALIIPTRRVRGQWRDHRTSWRELDQLCERLAAGLQHRGIGSGVRVALMVPPSLEFFALFFALFKTGAVPILIDPGIGLRPLGSCLGEARPEVFVGVTRAQIARMLFGWSRASVRQTLTIGPRPFGRGLRYRDLLGRPATSFEAPPIAPDDPAAILFTSGSTGIPKGVVYRHRHFLAQMELVRSTYAIEPGEVDLPTFPPFALFDPALGMTTVIPKMDFTRPARANPDMLVSMIEQYRVTNLFGSPALMNTLSRHLDRNGLRLPTLKRVLSAGAPVAPDTVERMRAALVADADLHTPYGATECLPVATISGTELIGERSQANREGHGICVGRPLAANRIRIIRIADQTIEKLANSTEVESGAIGEICVLGPTTTDCYWQREAQTRLAKMNDEDGEIWHRMGDLGWLDQSGRLWYCGRKTERVEAANGPLYTERVEGIVNATRGVFRSALVGVGEPGCARPVVIVEPEHGKPDTGLTDRVLARLQTFPQTESIDTVLLHPALPVDIRHNAKIRRPLLARWAGRKLAQGH